MKAIRNIIIGTVLAIASVNSVQAELGDSIKKSVARFGKPTKVLAEGWLWWVANNDNTICAKFNSKGICIAMEYRRFGGSGYSGSELLTRISANVSSKEGFREIYLKEAGRFWVTESGSCAAILLVEENRNEGERNPILLSVMSKEYMDQIPATTSTATASY